MEVEVGKLLCKWEYERLTLKYDPLPLMKRLSEILESEIEENFLQLDSLYNKWMIIPHSEFYQVLLDDYVQRSQHNNRKLKYSLDLKTTAVRLLLCISYVSNIRYNKFGLQIKYTKVVPFLIKWTSEAPEPLQTYATGLLDVYINDQKINFSYWPSGKKILTCLLERLVSNHIPSQYDSNSCWQLSPLKLVTKQIYIFRMLNTLCGFKDHALTFMNSKAFHVLMYCLDASHGLCVLLVETGSYLTKLMKSKNFAHLFIDKEGVQILMRNPHQSIACETSLCLKNLSMSEEAMEHLCNRRPWIAKELTLFVLKFFDNTNYHVRCNALVFFGLTFSYKLMLDEFDKNGGLQKMEKLLDDILAKEWNDMNMAFVAYKRYIQAHLLLKYNELRGDTTPITILKPTNDEVNDIIEKMYNFWPFQWKEMDNIVNLGTPASFLKIVNYRSFLHVDEEKFQTVLDVLSIFSLMPKIQLMICKQIDFVSKPTSGMEDILISTNSFNDMTLGLETIKAIQKSSLKILVNCVCVPISEKKDDNVVLEKSWNKLRECDGLLILHELLDPEQQTSQEVRNLACKALCGLARNDDVKRIICNMPLYKLNQFKRLIITANDPSQAQLAFNKLISKLLKLVESMDDSMLLNVNLAIPNNFLTRLAKRETGLGKIGNELGKKIMYNKFRCFSSDFNVVRKTGYKFTCIKFMAHANSVVIGDNKSALSELNFDTGVIKQVACAYCYCESVDLERTGMVMLTSCWKGSSLRSIPDFANIIFNLDEDNYAQFGNWDQKRILASRKQYATIVDVNTGIDLMKMKPIFKNNYELYKAAFSMDDKQVLFDGVLFDVDTGKSIFKFEKLNRVQNGIFHPNGYEVIINQEIWDLRTRSLLKTVPTLDHRKINFCTTNNIMYASPLKNCTTNLMHILDSGTYNHINTMTMDGNIADFDVNHSNTTMAIAEYQKPNLESVVKLYHVGLSKIQNL